MRTVMVLAAFLAAALAACGSTPTPAGSSTAVPGAASATIAAASRAPTQSSAAATAAPEPSASPVASAGADTGGTPASPVACSLLTRAEAAAALGVPVNAGAPAVDPTANVCSFGGHALADMVKFVEVEVVSPVEFTPGRASVAGQFEIIPVTGAGDAAYYQKDILPNNSGTRWSLSVRKGPTVIRLDIVLPGASDAAVKAAEMRLATAALTRF